VPTNVKRALSVAAALLGLLASGCSASEHSASGVSSQPLPSPRSDAAAIRDGTSFRTAIVIQGSTEDDGVPAEYAWIRQHLPGYSLGAQKLQTNGGRTFDVFEVKTPAGRKMNLYIDISAFVGKFEAPSPSPDFTPSPGAPGAGSP
jgi:hypothetical protein